MNKEMPSDNKYFPIRMIQSYALLVGKQAEKYAVFPLYTMKGVAPTYWNKSLGGKHRNVTMNWFRDRLHPLRINYNAIFGREDYTANNVLAVNQLFLGEEAWIFKRWMDAIYPEENTTIYKIDYPIDKESPTAPPCGVWEEGKGSFHCFDARWTYDWLISYWVDVTECELMGTDP